jgi:hypothetical protein
MTPSAAPVRHGSEYPPTGTPPKRRRWVQWLVVAVLILVPSGYGAVAAVQSRDTDGAKSLKAEMAGLVDDWPARMQRSIYQVPIPYDATKVAYFESNSWQTSSLYVQFTTTAGGLDTFLAQLGAGREDFRNGAVTITADQAKRVGWKFSPGHDWAGAALPAHGDKPRHEITVNLDNPDKPSVYVVSTVNFH